MHLPLGSRTFRRKTLCRRIGELYGRGAVSVRRSGVHGERGGLWSRGDTPWGAGSVCVGGCSPGG